MIQLIAEDAAKREYPILQKLTRLSVQKGYVVLDLQWLKLRWLVVALTLIVLARLP